MAKFDKKLKALKLRRSGQSIIVIAKKLGVSKGSISSWCRNVKLTPHQKEQLLQNSIKAGHKGRLLGAETNHRKKQERIDFYRKSGTNDVGTISDRDLLMAGVALYWGEGSKNNKLAFSNSDPAMIKFMFKWFQKTMGVDKNDFMPRIAINDMHKPRADRVLKFWSNLLKLPETQFGNTTFLKIKNKKIYENYDSYYGVMSLRIRRSSELKYRILGLIEALRDK